MRRVIILAIALILCTSMAQTPKLDGNWKGVTKMSAEGDPFYFTLRLKTEAENLSGMITSDFGNFDILEGTFDGEDIKFSWLLTFKEDSTVVWLNGKYINDDLIEFYWGDLTNPVVTKANRGAWALHGE